MNLKKLRLELEKLRGQAANLGQVKLERFAKKLDRTRAAKSTKELQWVSPIPGLRPISIPAHKKLKRFTAASILDAFEADLDYMEDHGEQQ